MSTSLASREPLPHGLAMSLDDFPDLPGSQPLRDDDALPMSDLLAWSEADDLRQLHVDPTDPIVNELPGEWQQPSEPLF